MKTIAIKRLHILPLPKGSGISSKHKQVLLSELAVLGYRVSNPELLHRAAPALFLGYSDVMKTLASMRGGDVAYVPLFTGFPSKVPDDNAYFCKRLLAYLDGHFADFDLRDFGADPISQFQTRSLFRWGKARQAKRKLDTHTDS